jgi:hypothetical protein
MSSLPKLSITWRQRLRSSARSTRSRATTIPLRLHSILFHGPADTVCAIAFSLSPFSCPSSCPSRRCAGSGTAEGRRGYYSHGGRYWQRTRVLCAHFLRTCRSRVEKARRRPQKLCDAFVERQGYRCSPAYIRIECTRQCAFVIRAVQRCEYCLADLTLRSSQD